MSEVTENLLTENESLKNKLIFLEEIIKKQHKMLSVFADKKNWCVNYKSYPDQPFGLDVFYGSDGDLPWELAEYYGHDN